MRTLAEELAPFLKAALPILPKSKRRITIKAYWLSPSRWPTTDASITTYDFKKFRINILTHAHRLAPAGYKTFKTVGRRHITRENMLLCLAHEIAHTVEWEHTPEHFALMAKIMARFTKVLKRMKVTATDTRRRFPPLP